MKLWTKVLFAIILSWSFMAGAMYVGSNIIIGKSYSHLEEQQIEIDLNKTKNALQSLINLTNSSLLGFALWDEMYDYAVEYNIPLKKDKNKTFLEANFQPDIFSALAPNYVDLVILFDTTGNINPAYSTQFNSDRKKFIPVSDEFIQLFGPSGKLGKLVHPAGENSDKTGLINTSKGVLILASHSIRMYSGKGNPHGTLLFGRYLDKTAWDTVNKAAQLNTFFYSVDQFKNPPTLKKIYSSLLTKKTLSIPINNKTRNLYTLVNDITGNPIGMIKIVMPRELNLLGQKMIYYFNLIFIISGIIFIILLFYLLRLLVINRLSVINRIITEIRIKKDFNLRLPETGNDEITSISIQSNHLLATINKVEILLRDIINSMPSLIILLDKHLQIKNLNDIAEQFLKCSINTAKNKNIFELMPFLKPYEEKINIALHEEKTIKIDKLVFHESVETVYYSVTLYAFKSLGQKILALRLDDISEQIKLEQKMEISNKLTAIGMLANGLTVEITQPANEIHMTIKSLQENISAIIKYFKYYSDSQSLLSQDTNNQLTESIFSETEKHLESLNVDSKKITSIIEQLKVFVRLDEYSMKKTNIHQGINAILTLSQHSYRDRITIIKKYGNLPDINVFPGRINQVFINILSYLIASIKEEGEIIIKTSATELFVTISIKGIGYIVNKEKMLTLFNPLSNFNNTTEEGNHELNYACHIIHDHQGDIKMLDDPKGIQFVITLPITQDEILSKEAESYINA